MTAPRVRQLRDDLDRTKERIAYARRELIRSCDSGRYDDPNAQRQHRTLWADLERAQTDYRWLEQSLDALPKS